MRRSHASFHCADYLRNLQHFCTYLCTMVLLLTAFKSRLCLSRSPITSVQARGTPEMGSLLQ